MGTALQQALESGAHYIASSSKRVLIRGDPYYDEESGFKYENWCKKLEGSINQLKVLILMQQTHIETLRHAVRGEFGGDALISDEDRKFLEDDAQ